MRINTYTGHFSHKSSGMRQHNGYARVTKDSVLAKDNEAYADALFSTPCVRRQGIFIPHARCSTTIIHAAVGVAVAQSSKSRQMRNSLIPGTHAPRASDREQRSYMKLPPRQRVSSAHSENQQPSEHPKPSRCPPPHVDSCTYRSTSLKRWRGPTPAVCSMRLCYGLILSQMRHPPPFWTTMHTCSAAHNS